MMNQPLTLVDPLLHTEPPNERIRHFAQFDHASEDAEALGTRKIRPARAQTMPKFTHIP